MKSRKGFKKNNDSYQRNQEEGIRIRPPKKQSKKINTNKLYSMIEEEEEGDLEIDLYRYDDNE